MTMLYLVTTRNSDSLLEDARLSRSAIESGIELSHETHGVSRRGESYRKTAMITGNRRLRCAIRYRRVLHLARLRGTIDKRCSVN